MTNGMAACIAGAHVDSGDQPGRADGDGHEVSGRERGGVLGLDGHIGDVQGDVGEVVAVSDQAGADHLAEEANESLEVDLGSPQCRRPLDADVRVCVEDAL